MSSSIFRRSIPLVVATFALNSKLPAASTNQIRLGIAYFEPPRSIGRRWRTWRARIAAMAWPPGSRAGSASTPTLR